MNGLIQLLTMEEVCRVLGKSRRTLRDWNRRRLITHIKVGGEDMYEVSAVLAFIDRNRRVARGETGLHLEPEDWGRIERLVEAAVNRNHRDAMSTEKAA